MTRTMFAGLRTLTGISLPFWPPMHPAPRRCSSFAYSRYAHSSRRRRAVRGVDLGPEGGTFIPVRILIESRTES